MTGLLPAEAQLPGHVGSWPCLLRRLYAAGAQLAGSRWLEALFLAGGLAGSRWDGISLLERGVHSLDLRERRAWWVSLASFGRLGVGWWGLAKRSGEGAGRAGRSRGMAGVSDPEPRSCLARHD
jgi:hypothetical protein